MAHIGENIKKFIEEKRIPPDELWKNGGISKATFYNYLKGRPVKAHFLKFLVQNYRLRAYWLLTGEGEMEWGSANDEVKFLCENILKNEEMKKTLYYFLKWQLKK